MKSKIVNDGYILAINHGSIGEPIEEEEFNLISEKMKNPPEIKDNQYAMLKDKDYTWEIFDTEE